MSRMDNQNKGWSVMENKKSLVNFLLILGIAVA
jgi:hypothetical protein